MPTKREFLESKNVKTLKGYIRNLNLHLTIKKYSTMKKNELVEALHKTTDFRMREGGGDLSVKLETKILKPVQPTPHKILPQLLKIYTRESDNLKLYEEKKK